jgi:LysM repeat protein
VNLDPRGRLAMGHAHHPIYDVSIPHFVELVARNVAKMREKGVGKIELVGRETLFGVPTVKLELTTPATGVSPTIENRQTLWDLADKSGQSMYVILHANELRGWTQADHPQPGDSVIIPDFYAGRMTLWIDEKLDLPVQADLYDHEGRLYEHYEHHDLKVGVTFTDADFDPKNKAYDF